MRALRLLLVVGVVVVAAMLRLRAVEMLPTDYDEDNYLRAAQQYAAALRAGDLSAVTSNRENLEHPPLAKLLYGVALAPLPPAPEVPRRPLSAPPAELPEPHFTVTRATGAAVGVLAVAALAVFDPVAALFLAVSTWQVKYTSEAMLEAVPALTSLLAVLFYLRWRRTAVDRWLVLSAIALGLTAATKYVYCIAGVAIALDWAVQAFRERRGRVETEPPAPRPPLGRVGPILAWSAMAVAVFLLANPYLWPDPVGRLRDSLLYHPGYATGESVRTANLPPWQPLVWLSGPVPWHPGVFLVTADALIGLLALAGLRRAWLRHRVFVLWLLLGLAFLLVWPAKWGQYVLVVTAPLSVVASNGFDQFIWEPLVRRLRAPRRLDTNETNVWTAVDATE